MVAGDGAWITEDNVYVKVLEQAGQKTNSGKKK